MTYSHSITIKQVAGGLSYTVGPAFRLSDKDPRSAFRDLVAENAASPQGAILLLCNPERFAACLPIDNGALIVRYRIDATKSRYMLLQSTPFSGSEGTA